MIRAGFKTLHAASKMTRVGLSASSLQNSVNNVMASSRNLTYTSRNYFSSQMDKEQYEDLKAKSK